VSATNAEDTRVKPRPNRKFERLLADYRDLSTRHLLDSIPRKGPPYLYDLVSVYPRRPGKGLRAALCFATGAALGGSRRQASIPIAINVGNATNLLALRRLMENRGILGPRTSWQIVEETERMMTYSLEGQAIELGWIRDNRCDLAVRDYMQMCLKKTSWYSFIYPMRVGGLVARPGTLREGPVLPLGLVLRSRFPDSRRHPESDRRSPQVREGNRRRPVGGQTDPHSDSPVKAL